MGGKTIVIGGGNVAIDVARTAIRSGAEDVIMFSLEKKEEMPALPDELEEAEMEGVRIENGWGPNRIITKNGNVVEIEFKRCISVFDENGHFSPKYDTEDLMTIPCNYIIASIGQTISWGNLLKDTGLVVTSRNTLSVDDVTLQAKEEDVFAGGDAITGPKFAINAIASGKIGAVSIQRYLLGNSLTMHREREYRPLDKDNLKLEGYDRATRQRIPKVDAKEARQTLKDTRINLTDEQLKKETSRCLGCGITVVDPEKCIGCGICSTKCEFDAIHLTRRYDIDPASGMEEYMGRMMEYSKTRMEKIAAKKKERI